MLNASRWRCDALIVRAGGIDVVELAGLTTDSVARRAHVFVKASQRAERAYQHLSDPSLLGNGLDAIQARHVAGQQYQTEMSRFEATLLDTMEWLWDELAGPVLAALRIDRPPAAGDVERPRVWWCPTGLLTLFPIHAAGHHRSGMDGSGRSVQDLVVSSYTPTLDALRRARDGAAAAAATMLVVAQADTPAQARLSNAERVRDLLTDAFSGRCTVLEGAAATTAAVSAQMHHHDWVHFSCHGDQMWSDPFSGGLELHDGMLTIASISARRHRGEFAFLAACKTAVGGLAAPDEAITLATALHYSGYRHVIGTLWLVADPIVADVAQGVYGDIAAGARTADRAAYALYDAIQQLRRRGLSVPYWAPFTHTGP